MERDTLSRTWLTILTIVMVLGFAGAAAQFLVLEARWSAMESKAEEISLQLKNFEQLAASLGVDLPQKPNAPASPSVDSRPFMPADYSESSPSPNSDLPTETVEYRNTEVGITFSVPYNPAWGNAKYKIRPFDEHRDARGNVDSVWFGPSGPFEGGGWVRWMFLSVRPASSTQDVIAALKAEAQRNGFIDENRIQTEDLGEGRQGVVYYSDGLCDLVSVVVIGKKFNYELSVPCGAENLVRESLLSVARTIRFIGN